MEASPGLMPAAITLTSTWPGPGTGRATSTTFRTSTSPYSSNLTASGTRGSLLERLGILERLGPTAPESGSFRPGDVRSWVVGIVEPAWLSPNHPGVQLAVHPL